MSRLEKIFGGLAKKPGDAHMHGIFDRYRDLMGAGDVDGIVALFAPDARWEEPVGSAPSIGHDAIRARYTAALGASGGSISMRPEGAARVAGNRALACSIARVSADGQPLDVESANVITCNDEGLITEMLVYVGLSSFKPAKD
ncbi:nuclear transport factor 2 family protein [Emcibacter sp. SYSU 3D8]|uniref:nuclear transport factor 2 family protein n=1 Tax=Emcibacter sp. SYSU 3D8 TaxID=3133969 RepID=UPI0031FEB9AD